jgi:hypothetical protein
MMITAFRNLSPAVKLIVGLVVVFLVVSAVLTLLLLTGHSTGSSGIR